MLRQFWESFLGDSPESYKKTIAGFLLANPLLYLLLPLLGLDGGFWVGWLILFQFIYTLALALRCYPLVPGGLIALEGFLLGMADPHDIYHELEVNLEVLLLLIFMVTAIFFMKDLLLFIFSNLLVRIRNKLVLSLSMMCSTAVLSAFLDALTVTAVLITATAGFVVAMEKRFDEHLLPSDIDVAKRELEAYLRNLVMHGLIGTALGGVCTLVGEPQNLLIASMVGWNFIEFMVRMAPVTAPAFVAGLLTCVVVEKTRLFDYGHVFDENIEEALEYVKQDVQRTGFTLEMRIQAVVGLLLCLALLFHVAAIGIIGLTAIVLLTAALGKTKEHDIAPAFHEAMPFTALLVVFFAVVALIHAQDLFGFVTNYILAQPPQTRPVLVFGATGLLSLISDNVFVATIYVTEIAKAFQEGLITRHDYDMMAVAINTGTNLPSIGTPNGQAAFLFMLTASLAPRIGLSYLRMVMYALPYTLVVTLTAAAAVYTMV